MIGAPLARGVERNSETSGPATYGEKEDGALREGEGCGLGFRVSALRFRVASLGLRVRVQGSDFQF